MPVSTINEPFFDASGHLVQNIPNSPPSTSDLNATQLATLLANSVDPTDAANIETWAANHLPKDGLTPVEVATDSSITSTVPDAEGTNPQFLEMIGQTGVTASIDTTNITGLHIVLFQGINNGEVIGLTVTGSHNAKVYTSDLTGGAGADSGDHFGLSLDASGSVKVVMRDDYGDSVTDNGSGHDHLVLGNGWGDIVEYNGSGVLNATLGAVDRVYLAATATGSTVTTNGADASITFGAGNNETIKALTPQRTLLSSLTRKRTPGSRK